MTAVERTVRILLILQQARYPILVSEFADQFGVSCRTIQRTGQYLRQAGVPVRQRGASGKEPYLYIERAST